MDGIFISVLVTRSGVICKWLVRGENFIMRLCGSLSGLRRVGNKNEGVLIEVHMKIYIGTENQNKQWPIRHVDVKIKLPSM